MRTPSAIAAGSIAIALFAGGFAAGHGVHHESSKAAAPGKADVLGQVFPRTPDASTTSTTGVTPQAPPTSQAPAPATTTTAPKATAAAAAPTPTTAPPTRTTTRQVNGA